MDSVQVAGVKGSTCFYSSYIWPIWHLSRKQYNMAEWDQLSSVVQSRPTLCDPMYCSTPGHPTHRQHPKLVQTHVHWVSDVIQPSHPLSSPSPPAFNLSQHQGLSPMSPLFASGGQNTGVSASTSVLPMNTQDWSTAFRFSALNSTLTQKYVFRKGVTLLKPELELSLFGMPKRKIIFRAGFL